MAESAKRVGRVYLGCSGWAYATWKPDFYPARTPTKKFLAYYASQLNSVEVNYTFRQMPKAATLEGWLGTVGDFDFQFSFKAPQTITHRRRLVDCREMLERFLDALEPVRAANRMGLVLFQLPPNLKADVERLKSFLSEAGSRKFRMAFEFRHASWFTEETFAALRDANAALCVAESDDLETPDVSTADYSCYRLRKTDYAKAGLSAIVQRLKDKAGAGDVFAYFKHEEAPDGPLRAREVLSQVRGS